ncbi:MAG: ATP-binding protein [Candidatus Marinimicrobia bacterium]|nr:ATP-binding protein [Candidatus Neomarinimicrobiota bacterium]
MRVEITSDLNLSPQEETMLDMHSFLNIMNVLNTELYLLGDKIDDEIILLPSLEHCQTIGASLSDRNQALDSARAVDKTKQIICDNINAIIITKPDMRDSAIITTTLENFNSIFDILKVRAREILARLTQGEQWVRYPIDQLTKNFINVFTAIELNSKGCYHIVYNIAAQTANDYLINFNISSVDKSSILIPAVFQDVMRDLIANARKYTPRGGTITAGLQDNGKKIRFVVHDTGKGIPPDEIEQVVQYGQRAKNVLNKKTMGGGFGLTKAYYVTKQLSGRMWIDSVIDSGTKIEIEFPRNAKKFV